MIRMPLILRCAALCLLIAPALKADAAVNVTVDPTASWQGYMNVFDLPANGGGYLWGSGWGTADLNAAYSGDVLTLTPNTSISRDVALTDGYWWTAGGQGNKQMEANFYVENSVELVGQDLTFSGFVLENSLAQPYTSVAFIKDFAPDYSSNVTVTVPLTPGAFSVSLATLPGAGRHVQYGFLTLGPNARLDQISTLGRVQLTAAPVGAVIPEPSTMMLLGASALGLMARRRKG